MMPKRIQRRRTKGWRKPEGVVNVTRPGKWGNPFKIGGWYRMGTGGDGMMFTHVLVVNEQYCAGHTLIKDAQMAVDWFRRYRELYPFKESELNTLRGKDLMCYCGPEAPCHADVLLELANPEEIKPI
jgi:hypothetical protein